MLSVSQQASVDMGLRNYLLCHATKVIHKKFQGKNRLWNKFQLQATTAFILCMRGLPNEIHVVPMQPATRHYRCQFYLFQSQVVFSEFCHHNIQYSIQFKLTFISILITIISILFIIINLKTCCAYAACNSTLPLSFLSFPIMGSNFRIFHRNIHYSNQFNLNSHFFHTSYYY